MPVTVLDCTDLYVKVKGESWDRSQSIPFTKLELSYDDRINLPEILRYDV